MANLTLKLDDDPLRKLTEAARKAGVTPERMAEMMLEAWARVAEDGPAPDRVPPGVGEPAHAWAAQADEGGSGPRTTPEAPAAQGLQDRLVDYDEFEWPEGGDPREDSAANYDLNEAGRPWSEVRPEFMALIDKTFGKPE